MTNKLRLRFSKTGKAKYISHLDLMATMRRGMLRAGVGLKYSEGFNPHPYMSAALPLPVGVGSLCELMDFGPAPDYLPPDNLPELLSEALPEGIEVFQAYAPTRKFADIVWVEINGRLIYDEPPPDAAKRLAERFAAESIIISKKTKKGISDIDIAPFVRELEFYGDSEITVKAQISAQSPSISPENLMSALGGGYAGLKPDFALFTRTEVFDSDMNVFR